MNRPGHDSGARGDSRQILISARVCRDDMRTGCGQAWHFIAEHFCGDGIRGEWAILLCLAPSPFKAQMHASRFMRQGRAARAKLMPSRRAFNARKLLAKS